MTEEELREAIRTEATDGRVSCKAMLELATKAGAEPRRIGMLCNELKLKITACQLGCFK